MILCWVGTNVKSCSVNHDLDNENLIIDGNGPYKSGDVAKKIIGRRGMSIIQIVYYKNHQVICKMF